eukprot:7595428-Ditylum_brightwellii.AAC.1
MSDHPTPVDLIPIEEEEALAATTIQAEILQWHYHLGHLSFTKIRLLSLARIIPYWLASVRPPKCAGCIYGEMTRRAWCTKSKENVSKIKPVKAPSNCVLVNQLKSSTLGFVAQLKGRLTKKRYHAATVFINHFSDLTYNYEQERLTSKETVAAKAVFGAFACNKGVLIKHYHADNG